MRKKKIVTTTFHLANNYGAMLQAFALQCYLLKEYDAKILNYNNDAISKCYKMFYKDSNILKTIYNYGKDLIFYKRKTKRINNFEKFRKKLKLTNYINNINEIDDDILKADIYITGSDQIWNPQITGYYDDIYFLNFGNDKAKRIAYAASSGNKECITNNIEIFKEKINKIDYISVRENEINDIVKKSSKKNVKTVLDPTLLLSKEEWEENFHLKQRYLNKKYIFAYSVGNGNDLYYKTINKIAKKLDCMVVYFDNLDINNKIKYKKKSYYSAGPEEFLNLLYNAELVITTSFHGVALSILFNKKLFVIPSTYADRIHTLLKTVKLEKRIVKNDDNIDLKIMDEIDWNFVNSNLQKAKDDSINWLISSIEE